MKKVLPYILTLIGVVLFCFLALRTDLHAIRHSFDQVGRSGFMLLVFCQMVVNLTLGLAWKMSVPDLSFIRLTSSRSVRDAAGNCLPFSQLGGMLIGIRAITAGKPHHTHSTLPFGWPEGVAANLMDVTTELLGQVAFIILALLCLMGHQDAGHFIGPLIIGVSLLVVGIAGFIWTQQHGGNILKRVAEFLTKRISSNWQDSLTGNSDSFQSYMESLWQRPLHVAYSATLHLLCWLGSAGITWLALHLLGITITFFDTTAIEGVVCGITSVGFFVPGSLGVQEGAYIALGHVFGIAPEIAMSISLLRRGRDIVIGIPTLLLWQLYEFRHLRRPPSSPS